MDRGLIAGLIESSAGEWVMIISLVFGGCCSNVWALEAVLKDFPNAGTFLTFAQFLYVTLQTASSQLYFPIGDQKSTMAWIPRIRKREVPVKRWLVQVFLFLAVSLMNNYAFGLKIPVTVHIIFRSGDRSSNARALERAHFTGLCVSMLTGYCFAKKRYSFGQIAAGVIITIGIVLATISAPRRRAPPKAAPEVTIQSTDFLSDNLQYASGILMLAMALFLSSCLGIFQEETYRLHGKKWREGLFYCHFLSLPFFLPFASSLMTTFEAFSLSTPVNLLALPIPTAFPETRLLSASGSALKDGLIQWRQLMIPSAIGALLLNVITQGMCVRGANRLTTRVNSTTVNLVLTIRKAVSLAISVWFYGSGATPGLLIGGAMVLGGTLIYSFAPPPNVLDHKKSDDVTADIGAIPLETRHSDKVVNLDNGLRQRTAKIEI